MQRSINPYDQSLLCEYPLMNPRDVEAKIVKSHIAYKSWRSTSFTMRTDLMKKVARLLNDNQENYARIISLEMGKAIREAKSEVQKCADGCLFYAEHAEEFLRDEQIPTEAVKSFVAYQPTGTILAIMPWNFPLWQVFRFAAPALMAGNVGLLKHTSNVPQCAMLIEKIFQEAGFPDGAFQSLIVNSSDLEQVIASDMVHGVALTGSEQAGTSVGALAGKHIKKSVLELGGSDPFIVLPDADLAKAVQVATQSRMQNAGQSCIAAKRFLVHKDIHEEFVHRFQVEIGKLKQGNQLLEETTTGPLARVDLANTLNDQLSKSIQQGARLVCGGKYEGANFEPTLIDHVRNGMPAFDEETFGPLASVISVESELEATELANRSRYGLGASVWTTDIERGERVAREIESGSVFVNSLMRSDARLPFGGVKKSGYGRELSFHGIREFVNTKTISVNK